MKKKNKIKEIEQEVKKNRKWIIVLSIVLGMLLFSAFATKIFLYVNFLLGNDIIISLEADKESIFITRGEVKEVSIKASVITNPFCKATCEFEFRDISSDTSIKKDNFTISPAFPMINTFGLVAPQFGFGQELYNFKMSCKSKKTILCHTDEVSTLRSMIIILNYNLSQDEELLRDELEEKINGQVSEIDEILSKQISIIETIRSLSNYVSLSSFEQDIIDINLDSIEDNLHELEALWSLQDYNSTLTSLKSLQEEIQEKKGKIDYSEKIINEVLFGFNSLLKKMSDFYDLLSILKDEDYTNQTIIGELDDLIDDFNEMSTFLLQKNSLNAKSAVVNTLNNRLNSVEEKVLMHKREESLPILLKLDMEYDLLCKLYGNCVTRPTILERISQTNFSIKKSCNEIDSLYHLYSSLSNKTSINSSVEISNYVSNLRQNITNSLLDNLGKGISATIIRNSFSKKDLGNFTSKSYDKELLLNKLIEQAPLNCIGLKQTHKIINDVNASEIVPKDVKVSLNTSFIEPFPRCCIDNKCYECCTGDRCNDDNYPVLFLHGHAFNKDTSAEYSLDAFNSVQEKLEEGGYINAGAMSLYLERDTPFRDWGLSPYTISIGASYYFDLYQKPESFILVETKSENVDTYAVKLKELVDNLKYRTGKSKVVLVVHSMGGLVARRYIQIFGENDVAKLILIAVPNNGIEGSILDFCPLKGEKLECRDMSSDSLFMNKLNRAALPDIPIYNLIAKGCDMNGEDGDGVVIARKAYLEGAKNQEIKGKCNGFSLFHTQLMDIHEYPEVYDFVIESINAVD